MERKIKQKNRLLTKTRFKASQKVSQLQKTVKLTWLWIRSETGGRRGGETDQRNIQPLFQHLSFNTIECSVPVAHSMAAAFCLPLIWRASVWRVTFAGQAARKKRGKIICEVKSSVKNSFFVNYNITGINKNVSYSWKGISLIFFWFINKYKNILFNYVLVLI